MLPSFRVFAIVEGLGDDRAIPALLRNYFSENALWNFSTGTAINSKGVGRLKAPFDEKKHLGIEHYILAALRGNPDGIVVVLDGDKECVERKKSARPGLGTELLNRAKTVAGNTPVAVVVADPEVEIWFLAAHEHLIQQGLLKPNPKINEQFFQRSRSGCKSVIAECLGRNYQETTDQVRLASHFEFKDSKWFPCSSLDKFVRDINALCKTISGT